MGNTVKITTDKNEEKYYDLHDQMKIIDNLEAIKHDEPYEYIYIVLDLDNPLYSTSVCRSFQYKAENGLLTASSTLISDYNLNPIITFTNPEIPGAVPFSVALIALFSGKIVSRLAFQNPDTKLFDITFRFIPKTKNEDVIIAPHFEMFYPNEKIIHFWVPDMQDINAPDWVVL